jgi:hypothetical protein
MTAAAEREQKSGSGWFMWIALAALPLIYGLSIGPTCRVVQRSGANPTVLRQFYAPIVWLHQNTILQKPIEAYLDQWGVKK